MRSEVKISSQGQYLPEESPKAFSHQTNADDFWEQQVWPAISALLRSKGKLTVDQLVEDLRIERNQAKAWLKRATGEQKVKKLSKPLRYVTGQRLLLDEQ